MSDLAFARSQMAMSLGFHILFAVAGMAMPVLMVIAELRYLRTRDAVYLDLARRWARGTAVLFAVGAVSGTVLSFELGLLWPTFMRHAGPIIGMPFSLEGFAFFLEAIFLGIYLYGWERVSPAMHALAGILVAVSGLMSGIFVVAVNAWMNTPSGVRLGSDGFVDIDLVEAFFSPAFAMQATHMVLAAYASVAMLAFGIHCACLRRELGSRLHARGSQIAFAVAFVTIPLQIVSGDAAAKQVARNEPEKLAAAEGLFTTAKRAPLAIGGYIDMDQRRRVGAIEMPMLLSLLAKGDVDAPVQGLNDFPSSDWPPVPSVNLAFQVMVAIGFLLLAVVAWGALLVVRRRAFASQRTFLRVASWIGPLGLVAVEAGWVVTEVGRQPWVIHGFLRTRDAVTPVPHLWLSFAVFTFLYIVLGLVVLVVLRAQVSSARGDA